jgi:hypothetical protein
MASGAQDHLSCKNYSSALSRPRIEAFKNSIQANPYEVAESYQRLALTNEVSENPRP